METLIKKQISNYVTQHDLILEAQFGFLEEPTSAAATEVVGNAWTALENKEDVALLLSNLSNAFDFVSFSDILQNLKFSGLAHTAVFNLLSVLLN